MFVLAVLHLTYSQLHLNCSFLNCRTQRKQQKNDMKNVSRFGSAGLQFFFFFFLIGVLCCGVEKCFHMEADLTRG